MKNLGMRSRGAFIAGIVLIALALVLSACGSSSSSSSSGPTSGTPKAGGTYNFPLEGGDPVGIAPNTYQESIGYWVVRQVFEGLMQYKAAADGITMNTVPDLCTEPPTVSADARVFTFTIRQGVYFQPPVNTEVTAQDFVASWNAVANPKNWVTGTPAYILEPIVGTDDDGRRQARPHRRQGDRQVDPPGHAQVPVRRVPGEPRPSRSCRCGRSPTP